MTLAGLVRMKMPYEVLEVVGSHLKEDLRDYRALCCCDRTLLQRLWKEQSTKAMRQELAERLATRSNYITTNLVERVQVRVCNDIPLRDVLHSSALCSRASV